MFRRARCFPVSAPFFLVCGSILVQCGFFGPGGGKEAVSNCDPPLVSSPLSRWRSHQQSIHRSRRCQHYGDRKVVFLGLPVHTVGLVTATGTESRNPIQNTQSSRLHARTTAFPTARGRLWRCQLRQHLLHECSPSGPRTCSRTVSSNRSRASSTLLSDCTRK